MRNMLPRGSQDTTRPKRKALDSHLPPIGSLPTRGALFLARSGLVGVSSSPGSVPHTNRSYLMPASGPKSELPE